MTWTYSGDPSSSPKDELRFLIGDTDMNDQLLQDEELDFILGKYPSTSRAQYAAIMSIASKCARLYRQETGRIKVWADAKYKHYMMLADQLKKDMAQGFSGTPYVFAGGISHTDMLKRNLDPDQVQTDVKTDMHDNPRYTEDYTNKTR